MLNTEYPNFEKKLLDDLELKLSHMKESLLKLLKFYPVKNPVLAFIF